MKIWLEVNNKITCILKCKELKGKKSIMIQLKYMFFFILILNFTNISFTIKTAPNARIVKVENYTIPIDETGSFYLYEVYENKVVLEKYTTFYFDKKDLKLNSTIRNEKDQVVGQIIGHHLHYYPVAPREYKKMYCENIELEQLVGENYVEYRGDKCAIVSEFYKSMWEVKKIPLPRKNICYIYM